MFSYKLGIWTLEFDNEYRIVKDNNTAVIIDEERTALVLISINENNNICIERTYYAMICEINAKENIITFHTTDNIG